MFLFKRGRYYHLEYFDNTENRLKRISTKCKNKKDASDYLTEFKLNIKRAMSTLTPEAIWVKGDFAVVHYYYSDVTKDKDGKTSTDSGRWTDILIKKGDKWVMIGDHGGETSD